MTETAWGPSYDGDVVVDIGGNVGALIIVTPPALAGREIEISPAGKKCPRSHVAVRERRGQGRSRFAAVFPALVEGDYTVWDPDGSVAASVTVTVTGGTVAQLEWTELPAARNSSAGNPRLVMDATEHTMPDRPPSGVVDLCAELYLARLRQGLTLDDLADRSGVRATLLDPLEHGALAAFPDPLSALRALVWVAHALNLDAGRLVTDVLESWENPSAVRHSPQPGFAARTVSPGPAGLSPAGPAGAVGDLWRRFRLRVMGRRRIWVAAAALAVAGGTLIGVGASAQDHPPRLVHNLGTVPPPVAAALAHGAAPVRAPGPRHATGTPTDTGPASKTTPISAPPASLPASLPLTLRIPAIGVSAPVVSLGRNPGGTLQVPPLTRTGVEEAGWYHLGPAPGQVGPAVIVGHVDSYQGPGVFYELAALRPGDTVQVTLQDHAVATFRIDAVDQFPKGSFPTRTVYGDVDYAGLRLITCGGAFDSAARQYLSNIVVFASLVRPTARRRPHHLRHDQPLVSRRYDAVSREP